MKKLSDLSYYRGDTEPISLVITSKTTGEPVDLTGYSFVMTVDERKDPDDTTTQVFSINGVVDSDQETNKGHIRFEPTEQQTDQEPGTYWYDIQMTTPVGKKKTLCKFKLTIKQDITKT